MADLMRGGVSRRSLAVRGALAVVVVLGAVVLSASGGAELFNGDPTVTSTVPAEAGPVRANSAVRYRGVVVGELSEVEAGTRGSRLTLRMEPAKMDSVPAGVRLRILPKTLFGDQYVDLAGDSSPGQGSLRPGSVVAADDTRGTVQIYRAYTRMYGLLTALRPAELQTALTTMADVLRGRGAEIGRTIDTLHDLSGRYDPQRTIGNMSEIAGLSKQLADASPDLLATLDDAVTLSRTVVEERQDLANLLSAGTALTAESQRFLDDNAAKAIEVVHTMEPSSEVLGANADQLTATLHNLRDFTGNASRTFKDDRFHIRAPVTLEDPQPYGPQDCPRYPGLNGPNCAQPAPPPPRFGGTVGPIGSEQEKRALADLVPPPATAGPSTPDIDTDVAGLLFGPVVRGTRVVVP